MQVEIRGSAATEAHSQWGNTMIMETLDSLLRSLDVKGASRNETLESDQGLDFETRLFMREDIEESLHIIFQNHDLKHDLTLLELAGLLSRKLLVTPAQEGFEGKLVEDIIISSPIEKVLQVLLDVNMWPHRLSYVRDVRLTYDDGLYQEFLMDVDSAHGRLASVRSVRRCEPDHIAYFQPQPACFLKHYCGDWFIRSLIPTATHLTIVKRWTSSVKSKALFPPRDTMSSAQQVSALLGKQARIALATWKRCLEQPSP